MTLQEKIHSCSSLKTEKHCIKEKATHKPLDGFPSVLWLSNSLIICIIFCGLDANIFEVQVKALQEH